MQRFPAEFVRVFDVVRRDPPMFSRGRYVETTFSFEDKDGTHYNVSVPGLPRIDSGMKVVALLARENDWSSLVGWLDTDTGEVVGINSATARVDVLVAILGTVGFAVALMNKHWDMSLFAMLAALWGCVVGLRQAKCNRELKALTPQ